MRKFLKIIGAASKAGSTKKASAASKATLKGVSYPPPGCD